MGLRINQSSGGIGKRGYYVRVDMYPVGREAPKTGWEDVKMGGYGGSCMWLRLRLAEASRMAKGDNSAGVAVDGRPCWTGRSSNVASVEGAASARQVCVCVCVCLCMVRVRVIEETGNGKRWMGGGGSVEV